MVTKFMQVAHLYQGCEMLEEGNHIGNLIWVHRINGEPFPVVNCSSNDPYHGNWKLLTPILYPIDKLNDKQNGELARLMGGFVVLSTSITLSPDAFLWCLNNSVDIWNLIPAGEAIDGTTLERKKR